MRGAVVAQHVAREGPVVAQDRLEQVLVLARVLAVQAVVGAHDRADVRLVDGRLEGRKVDLAERALVDHHIDGVAVAEHAHPERHALRCRPHAFLVIGGEVLHVGDHALALRALDPGDGHAAGQPRILAVAFEGPAAERRPHDVDRGREDDVVALALGFVADRRAVARGEGRIPGRGEADGRGHRRRHAGAHAHRAVGVVDGGQIDARHPVAGAGVRARLAAHAEEVVAPEERDPFVRRELLQQEPGARVGRQRGVAPGMIAAAARGVRPAGGRDQQEEGAAERVLHELLQMSLPTYPVVGTLPSASGGPSCSTTPAQKLPSAS